MDFSCADDSIVIVFFLDFRIRWIDTFSFYRDITFPNGWVRFIRRKKLFQFILGNLLRLSRAWGEIIVVRFFVKPARFALFNFFLILATSGSILFIIICQISITKIAVLIILSFLHFAEGHDFHDFSQHTLDGGCRDEILAFAILADDVGRECIFSVLAPISCEQG